MAYKIARMLITKDCPRNCDGCCNKDPQFAEPKIITSLHELIGYNEILITGGEPMLYPEETLAIIKRIRNMLGKSVKIYLYAAYYDHAIHEKTIWSILDEVDGLHYTLHHECTDKDVVALKDLSHLLFSRPKVSRRLAIDKRLYERYDFNNLDLKNWDVIRKLVWLPNCPLPPHEELMYYKP